MSILEQTEQSLAEHDWEDLQQRYSQAVAVDEENTSRVYGEFQDLIKFFNIWMESAQSHETENAQRRLNTQIRHVQLSEEKIEEKRDHYVKVVQAFQNALELLGKT